MVTSGLSGVKLIVNLLKMVATIGFLSQCSERLCLSSMISFQVFSVHSLVFYTFFKSVPIKDQIQA